MSRAGLDNAPELDRGLDPLSGGCYDCRVELSRSLGVAVIAVCAAFALLRAQPVKSEGLLSYREATFSTNPMWDGYRNRPPNGELRCKGLNFALGWIPPSRLSPAGAIGGTVARSTDYRAYYAKVLEQTKTLDDVMTAEGTLRLDSGGQGGLLFGWFNSATSFGWRTPDFLGLRLDGSRAYGEYATTNAFAGTTDVAKFGSRHDYLWKLEYLPDGGTTGTGLLRLTLGKNVLERSIRSAHRLDGARFDRFGLLNSQVEGPDLTARFANLTVDGEAVDLLRPPDWEGSNNQLQHVGDCVLHKQQNFGYSAGTQFAGGAPGEVGGVVWRVDNKAAYYGDPITPVGLSDGLYAEGDIDLEAASSDADVFIGWFGSASKRRGDLPQNLVAAAIGGPSEWGTRIVPVYSSGAGTSGSFAPLLQFDRYQNAPLLAPKHRVWRWWICYRPPDDPSESGQLTVGLTDPRGLLPDSRAAIRVRSQAVSEGAVLDRFGIRNLEKGGHSLTFYLDNLRYTSGPGDAGPDDRCTPPS